jgi:hypothetical protein
MKRRFYNCLAGSTIAALVIVAFLPIFRTAKIRKPSRVELKIVELLSALKEYKSVYGAYPEGEGTLILKKLLGENQRQKVFLDPSSVNTNGDYSDPWGNPFKIEVVERTNLLFTSAGPNHQFGDKDDISFDSSKPDLVKR